MLPNQNSKNKLFARTVFKICGTQQVLILNNKAFDGVRLPEILTLEPRLCLKVQDGNRREILT